MRPPFCFNKNRQNVVKIAYELNHRLIRTLPLIFMLTALC